MIYVLGNLYSLASGEVAATLRDLLDTPGITTLEELSWSAVLELWPETIPTFGDAVVAILARSHRLAVATFDRGLLTNLRREGIPVHEL